MLACIGADNIEGHVPFTVKPNYGVLFREMGVKFHASQSTLDTIFILSKPKWPRYKRAFNFNICAPFQEPPLMPLHGLIRNGTDWSKIDLNMDCSELSTSVNDRVNRYNIKFNEVKNATYSLNKLISQTEISNDTSKRAILGFLGDAIGSVFGVATEHQIQNLYNHIQVLQSNTQTAVSSAQGLRESVGKVVKVTNERFEKVWLALEESREHAQTALKETQRWRQDVADRIAYEMHTITEKQSWVIEVMNVGLKTERMLQDQAEVLHHLNIWIDSFVELSQNRLPIHLVTPAVLGEHLKEVASKLQRKSTNQKLLHDHRDLAFYYSEKVTTVLTMNDNIYIHLYIPIGDRETSLTVYDINIFPVSIHQNASQNSNVGYTKLQSDYNYLAVAHNKQFYQLMTAQDLQICQNNLHGQCPALGILKDRSTASCEFSLFIDDHENIKASCEFKYYHDKLSTYVIKASDSTYLISSPDHELIVLCERSRRHYDKTPYVVIRLPCGCQLTVNQYFIPKSISNCFDDYEIKVGYPLNIPQIAAFSLEDAVRRIKDKPILSTPPVLHVPQVSEWQGFENMTKRDKQLGVDLEDMASELINSPLSYVQDTFESPFESVFDNLQWEFIVILSVALGWFCLLSLLIAVLFLKLRSMATLLVLLEKVRRTDAALKESSKAATTSTKVPPEIDTRIAVDMDILIAIISILAIQLTAVILYRICKRIRNKGYGDGCPGCISTVYLVLANAYAEVQIALVDIPFALKEISCLIMPDVNLFEVLSARFGRTQLRVNYDKLLSVTGYGQNYQIRLPTWLYVEYGKGQILYEMYSRKEQVQVVKFFKVINKCQCINYVTSFDDCTTKQSIRNALRKSVLSHKPTGGLEGMPAPTGKPKGLYSTPPV